MHINCTYVSRTFVLFVCQLHFIHVSQAENDAVHRNHRKPSIVVMIAVASSTTVDVDATTFKSTLKSIFKSAGERSINIRVGSLRRRDSAISIQDSRRSINNRDTAKIIRSTTRAGGLRKRDSANMLQMGVPGQEFRE